MNEKLSPQEIAALKQEILSSLHCALPGMVVAFDQEHQTAEIRLAKKGLPVLRGVPVFLPAPFEIREGDACLVVFADHDIDAWLESGEDGQLASGRMHSLSDGFAFIGFKTHSEFRMQNEGDVLPAAPVRAERKSLCDTYSLNYNEQSV